MTEPILAVISGFLGAGKTTLSTNLIAHLWEKDVNAALITNDQSSGLVDSEIAAAGGLNVKEISGGCFCCRCDEFALALDEIIALRQADIVIAEAVGSCTDLVATVVEPLRIDLQKPYRVLPMVVVVDPDRAEAVLCDSKLPIADANGTNEPLLHDDVTYIFLKQLEEAQVILVNKADALEPRRLEAIIAAVPGRFPEAHGRGFVPPLRGL
jgi:G3E family GTPase